MHANAFGVLQRVIDHVDENPLQSPGCQCKPKVVGVDGCKRYDLFKSRKNVTHKG